MKKMGILLWLGIAILLAIYLPKIIKGVSGGLKDGVKDTLANNPIGNSLGLRTSEAARVVDELKMNKLLTEGAYEAGLEKYIMGTRGQNYHIDKMTLAKSESIAKNIYEAKGNLPFGWNDKDSFVVAEIRQIQNQAQAMQVAHAFYWAYKKDLGVFLNFLGNSSIVLVNNHLQTLPTGIYKKANNEELKTI